MTEPVTPAGSEPTSDPNPGADADPPNSWRERARSVGPIRFLIGGLGCAGLVLGAILAWHTGSATTLLIVSAVLLLLAALGLDWRTIRGKYGGWTVELLRDVGERIEQVAAATAASPEVPAELRAELELLRGEVKALNDATIALVRPRRLSAPRPSAISDALIADLTAKAATHSFQGSDSVLLMLRIVSAADRFVCSVKAPSGEWVSKATRRPIDLIKLIGVPKQYQVTYPDEFEGSGPLTPGRYEVEWRQDSPPSSATQGLAAALIARSASPIATDSFTIPGAPGHGSAS